MQKPIHTLEVTVSAAAQRDKLLCNAEAALKQAALSYGKAGILITRDTPNDYTLTVDASIPFGQTHTRDRWHRPVVPAASAS